MRLLTKTQASLLCQMKSLVAFIATASYVSIPLLLAPAMGIAATPPATQDDQVWRMPTPPETEQKVVTLGQQLFFDPRILGKQKTSCADCHHPGFSWSEPELFEPQHTKSEQWMLSRQTPSLLNIYGYKSFFWDGRVDTSLTAAINRHIEVLASDVRYRSQAFEWTYTAAFKASFGDTAEISRIQIAQALASYIATLSVNDSPFDRWLAGKNNTFSPSAERGFRLFTGKAACINCHQPPYFTDSGIHNIGLKSLDPGYYEVTHSKKHNNAFRTPMLRQASRTMPYMHNGSLRQLSNVIAFYNQGGTLQGGGNTLKPLHLSKQEQADLLAFLLSLESPEAPATIPPLPVTAQ